MAGLINNNMFTIKKCQKLIWSLLALMIVYGPFAMDAMEQSRGSWEGDLILKTDDPAILDAPITVTAILDNAKDYSPPFYFSFSKC